MQAKQSINGELPHNIPAEKAVVGSILLDPGTVRSVLELVDPQDFYSESARLLFESAIELHKESIAIDPVTLVTRLKANGHLEKAGGPAEIAKAFTETPTSRHSNFYAKLVRQASIKRQLISAALETLADCYDQASRFDDVADKSQGEFARLKSLAESIEADGCVLSGLEVVERIEFEDYLQATGTGDLPAAENPDGVRIVSTPWCDLNTVLAGGPRSGELIVIAARPSHGKSAMAINYHDHVSASGRRSLFVTLEMSAVEIVDRIICARGRCPLDRRRANMLNAEQLQNYISTRERLKAEMQSGARGDIYLEESDFRKVLGVIRKQHARQPLDIVTIDYLQLLTGMDSARNSTRSLEIGKMTRQLKSLAREINVPIVVLSQVNRDSGDSQRPPRLSELRESGAIEQDADVVIFVHRPAMYSARTVDRSEDASLEFIQQEGTYAELADVVVAKQRNGGRVLHELLYFAQQTRFEERSRYSDGEW